MLDSCRSLTFRGLLLQLEAGRNLRTIGVLLLIYDHDVRQFSVVFSPPEPVWFCAPMVHNIYLGIRLVVKVPDSASA